MGDIVAVLVVPAAGDPGGLVFGASRIAGPTGPVETTRQGRAPEVVVRVGGIPRSALPLWWDGALVPEGWDRLRRALATLPHDQRPTGPLWGWLHDFWPLPSSLRVAAEFAVSAGLAERVVLLARQDGRMVEVTGAE